MGSEEKMGEAVERQKLRVSSVECRVSSVEC